MTRITLGIVDYGAGNHVSLLRCLQVLGYRARVAQSAKDLNNADIIVLPGVGAFPPAMEALHRFGLVEYLRDAAREGRPVLGVCLGMQLLSDCSYENGKTFGLGLIPGDVVALENPRWHIGWNGFELAQTNPFFSESSGDLFYFNHSYTFDCHPAYQVCRTHHGRTFAAAIQKENVVGVQFHPEKSQAAGRRLLKSLVDGLYSA